MSISLRILLFTRVCHTSFTTDERVLFSTLPSQLWESVSTSLLMDASLKSVFMFVSNTFVRLSVKQEILRRKKENEAAKEQARSSGDQVNLKRTPKLPKDGYFLEAPGDGAEITTVQPLPFSDLV
jgi:hypothetical protein